MNAQLELHLETFDSDEEYSEAPVLHEDEHVEALQDPDGLMDPLTETTLKVKAEMRKFVKPSSLREILEKILWLLPFAIAIGDYVGMVFSTLLSFGAAIVMQLKPIPVTAEQQYQKQTSTTTQTQTTTNGGRGRRRSSLVKDMQQQQQQQRRQRRISTSRSSSVDTTSIDSNRDMIIDNIEVLNEEEHATALQSRKRTLIHDCRKEVSRLLGLVGSPPLGWTGETFDNELYYHEHHSRHSSRKEDQILLRIHDGATLSVVKFLEAHIQFLLTIDQAYQYLRISTSLHLGLGPNSQCVERVERATIAKDYRRRSSSSSSSSKRNNNNYHSTSTKLRQPQQSLASSNNIIALSNVKTSLAMSMVRQSHSLIEVWKHIRRSFIIMQGSSSNDDDDIDDDFLPTDDMDILILQMPTVVDLSWIKSSRHQLSKFLCHMMDYFCTIEVLYTLSVTSSTSSSTTTTTSRSKLEESMYSVRNATEHLSSTLMLRNNNTAVQPLLQATNSNNDGSRDDSNLKLLRSLIQYRDHLDAMNAAIWSCQLYAATTDNDTAVVVEALGTKATGTQINSAEQEKKQWWSHVQRLGSTCRALEEEIGQKFHLLKDEGDDELVEERQEDSGPTTDRTKESENYEHDNHETNETEVDHQGATTQTKTVVFKGKGAVKTELNTKSQGMRCGAGVAADNPMVVKLPPRDTVSEQLMVNELKNRLQSICPPDEDDEDGDSDDDVNDKDKMEPLLDSDHRNESVNNIITTPDGTATRTNCRKQKQTREVTGTHFLGATGSLLSELKVALPAVDDAGEELILGK